MPVEVLYVGSKSFWRTKTNLEITVLYHRAFQKLEIIASDPADPADEKRLYADYYILKTKIDHDLLERTTLSEHSSALRQKRTADLAEIQEKVSLKLSVDYVLERLHLRTSSSSGVFTEGWTLTLQSLYNDQVDPDTGKSDVLCTRPPGLEPFVRRRGSSRAEEKTTDLPAVASPSTQVDHHAQAKGADADNAPRRLGSPLAPLSHSPAEPRDGHSLLHPVTTTPSKDMEHLSLHSTPGSTRRLPSSLTPLHPLTPSTSQRSPTSLDASPVQTAAEEPADGLEAKFLPHTPVRGERYKARTASTIVRMARGSSGNSRTSAAPSAMPGGGEEGKSLEPSPPKDGQGMMRKGLTPWAHSILRAVQRRSSREREEEGDSPTSREEGELSRDEEDCVITTGGGGGGEEGDGMKRLGEDGLEEVSDVSGDEEEDEGGGGGGGEAQTIGETTLIPRIDASPLSRRSAPLRRAAGGGGGEEGDWEDGGEGEGGRLRRKGSAALSLGAPLPSSHSAGLGPVSGGMQHRLQEAGHFLPSI